MTARKITQWMLVPVGIIYLSRIIFELALNFDRNSIGLIFICCPVALGFAAIMIGVAAFVSHKVSHPAPAFVVLGTLLLVPFLPLPPLPQAVLPEETFFYEHRAEFEQVIELAREDNLNCLANTGCDVMARELPVQYGELSRDRIVYVSDLNPAHLSVEFHPIDPYYPVVYFEVPEDRDLRVNSACNYIGTSRYGRKLDEHWYLCVEEW